jgi:KUP system potassium uptake protein
MFLVANLLKIVSGGWVPLFIGAMLILVMVTWIRGADRLLAKTRRIDTPLPDPIAMMTRRPPAKTKGVAVFLTADPDNAPTALMHSLKHYRVLHEHNVILTVRFTDEAHVPNNQRVEQTELSPFFSKVIIRVGFMDAPNVPKALGMYQPRHGKFEVASTSFFLSRRSLQPSRRGGMPLWQDKLFIFLARNASDATAYFQIPTDRAVEIGTRITI